MAEMCGKRPVLSVVIPVKNEARNIGHVLQRLPDRVDEILLVDGNSVDGTVEVALAMRPDIRVVRQTRRGKGNALAAGFEAASGDYIVMIDADNSMDPAEIPLYVAALDFGAEYVKGSRFAVGGGSSDISRIRRLGNSALLTIANALFRSRYTDLCYGMNGFQRSCLDAFNLPQDGPGRPQWGDGFEIETILNLKAAKARLLIHEVPSFESERLHGESNLRTFRDGSRVLVTILREWLGSRRRFGARNRAEETASIRATALGGPAEWNPANDAADQQRVHVQRGPVGGGTVDERARDGATL